METTIGTRELFEIIKVLHIDTIRIYLNNYRFSKHRATPSSGHRARYYLTQNFLNVFYTMLLARGKEKAAKNLKDHFKDLEWLEWEEYVK
jgi:hypothetical protein